MQILLSLHRLFACFAICFFIANCTHLHNSKKHHITDSLYNAPKGSRITPYTRDNSRNYKIFLARNLGEKRSETEMAVLNLPINFKELSFELSSDDSLHTLKTPIKLIDITDSAEKSILSLNLKDKLYWLETPNDYQKVPLFLEQELHSFIIKNHKENFIIHIDNVQYKLPIMSTNHTLKIGLIRSDLLRYKGLVVPKQHLEIHNIRIIP